MAEKKKLIFEFSKDDMLKIADAMSKQSWQPDITRRSILAEMSCLTIIDSPGYKALTALLAEQLHQESATKPQLGLKNEVLQSLEGLLNVSLGYPLPAMYQWQQVKITEGADRGKFGEAVDIVTSADDTTGFPGETSVKVRLSADVVKWYPLQTIEVVHENSDACRMIKMMFNEFTPDITTKVVGILNKKKAQATKLRDEREQFVSCETARCVAERLYEYFHRDYSPYKKMAEAVKSQKELEEFLNAAKSSLEEKLKRDYERLQKKISAVKRKAETRPWLFSGYYNELAFYVREKIREAGNIVRHNTSSAAIRVANRREFNSWLKTIGLPQSYCIKEIEASATKECIESIVKNEIEEITAGFSGYLLEPDFGASHWINEFAGAGKKDAEYRADGDAAAVRHYFDMVCGASNTSIAPTIDDIDINLISEQLVKQIVNRACAPLIDKAAKGIVDDSFISALIDAGMIRKTQPGISQAVDHYVMGFKDSYTVQAHVVNRLAAQKRRSDRKLFYNSIKLLNVNCEILERAAYIYSPYSAYAGLKGKQLEPYEIGRIFLNELIAAAKTYASNDRHKSLADLAAKIIQEKTIPNQNEFARQLSKLNKMAFLQLVAMLEKEKTLGVMPSKQFRVYNFNEMLHGKDSLDSVLESKIGAAIKGSELYLAYRDMAASEMIGILEAAGERGRGAYESFRIFWERYKPFEYDLPQHFKAAELKKVYRFYLTRNPEVLYRAAENCGSCLMLNNAKELTADSGTINLIVTHGRESKGYMRMYITKTGRGESALALDNIEINHKEFNESKDSIRAMGLAAFQLGLDMNIKYILACDGRIGYGIRQAFGNKKMKTTLHNIGANVDFSYTFRFDDANGTWSGDAGVVMQNWRG